MISSATASPSLIGVFDLSHAQRRWRMSGEDRVTFLHGQCTNHIKRLQPGQACYAAFLNAKGKMRGDGEIVCLADAFLLSSAVDLQAALERFIITEDVIIEPADAAWGAYAVWGDRPAGEWVFANRMGGWTVFGDRPAGAVLSEDQFEIRRMEAGVPRWGMDMDETTIPVEAGLNAWAIDYDKGCYIGQETIARIKTYGHVNRHLVQLALAALPDRGTALSHGEREIGAITSAILSPRLGKALALGYVRREFATAGTAVQAGNQPAEVIKLCGE